MTRLARTFPSLAGAAGVEPWEVEGVLRWALTPELPAMALHAVRFLLQVWAPDRAWPIEAVRAGICPPSDAVRLDHPLEAFNFAAAFRVWDAAHRAAVTAWCAAPFHPGP